MGIDEDIMYETIYKVLEYNSRSCGPTLYSHSPG